MSFPCSKIIINKEHQKRYLIGNGTSAHDYVLKPIGVSTIEQVL